MKRRAVLAGVGAVAGLGAVLGAAGYGLRLRAANRYAAAATACRAPLNPAATGADRLRDLVRIASLAPNSHNTQAWTFAARPDGVLVAVDPARRTPVVDPDDHHLFVSLGCAVETLIIAATGYGIAATPDVAGDGTVMLRFTAGADLSPLLPAITRRQSHRGLYDGAALTQSDRLALMAADPDLRLIADLPRLTALRDLTVAAYATQMSDAAYRDELKFWLRFSEPAALQTRDGLFAGCSGSPPLPQGLGRVLFPVIVTAKAQAAALAAQMASAATLALLVTAADTPAGRIETGRRLQRISLTATLAGLAVAHVNPALETAAGRREIARICDVTTGRPSILLRLGRAAAAMPYSLRRPPQHTLQTPR